VAEGVAFEVDHFEWIDDRLVGYTLPEGVV
jgi:hypothetical protein